MQSVNSELKRLTLAEIIMLGVQNALEEALNGKAEIGRAHV